MTVGELKKALEFVSDDLHIVIPAKTYEKGVLGGMDGTYVLSAHQGFDWDSSKLILIPAIKLRAVEFRQYNKSTNQDTSIPRQ